MDEKTGEDEQNVKDVMTPERAERITRLGAKLSQVMWDAQHDGKMPMFDVFAACAMGVRGLAEVAALHLSRKEDLPLADARKGVLAVATVQIHKVFAMPPELFKTIDDGKGDDDTRFEAMPARPH